VAQKLPPNWHGTSLQAQTRERAAAAPCWRAIEAEGPWHRRGPSSTTNAGWSQPATTKVDRAREVEVLEKCGAVPRLKYNFIRRAGGFASPQLPTGRLARS